jgi:hypothetical protein
MTSDPEEQSNPEVAEEKQLCANCMFPNYPEAHFCAKCGAPLSSYASTGPFESLFAEGHVYRQATEQPRKLVVVFGIWLIFGVPALGFIVLLVVLRGDWDFRLEVTSALFIAIAIFMIWKSTRNYFVNRRAQTTSTEE